MVAKKDRRLVVLWDGGRGKTSVGKLGNSESWGKNIVCARQAAISSDGFSFFLFQDVSETSCSKYPRLYIPGQKNLLFNKKIFFLSLLYGTLTSLAIFFISYGVFQDRISNIGLETSSVYFFGTVVAAILVVVVNIEVRRRSFDDTNN